MFWIFFFFFFFLTGHLGFHIQYQKVSQIRGTVKGTTFWWKSFRGIKWVVCIWVFDMEAVLLYCCPDCPSCLAHLNSIGWGSLGGNKEIWSNCCMKQMGHFFCLFVLDFRVLWYTNHILKAILQKIPLVDLRGTFSVVWTIAFVHSFVWEMLEYNMNGWGKNHVLLRKRLNVSGRGEIKKLHR